jgi:hypothetical protein
VSKLDLKSWNGVATPSFAFCRRNWSIFACITAHAKESNVSIAMATGYAIQAHRLDADRTVTDFTQRRLAVVFAAILSDVDAHRVSDILHGLGKACSRVIGRSSIVDPEHGSDPRSALSHCSIVPLSKPTNIVSII